MQAYIIFLIFNTFKPPSGRNLDLPNSAMLSLAQFSLALALAFALACLADGHVSDVHVHVHG